MRRSVLTLCLLLPFSAFAQQWVGTWASSPQLADANAAPPAPGLAGSTLRQIVHVSIGGRQMRVRFSNAFGTTPLTIAAAHVALAVATDGSAIKPSSDKALGFRGQPSVTIPPGALALSDSLDFDLAPLSDLDRKSTRLNSSHIQKSRMPSSA